MTVPHQILVRAPSLPPVLPIAAEAGPGAPALPLPDVAPNERAEGLAAFFQGASANVARAHQEYMRRSLAAHAKFLEVTRTLTPWSFVAPTTHAPPPPTLTADVTPAPPALHAAYPGPRLERDALVTLGSGQISAVFGLPFAPQDAHALQLRIAKPPLLLMDRVLGIEGVPGSMGHGRIWSEYVVPKDGWFVDDHGRMPFSIVCEAGQANIVLMSYLGADLQHAGDRAFRFLGCDVTVLGAPPEVGETLAFEIGVERYAQLGNNRLFFLWVKARVDGELRIEARMQSGLFTARDLDPPQSLAWDPVNDARTPEGPCDPPYLLTTRTSLSRDQVQAFRDARPFDCFGPGFERAQAHVQTPRIAGGRMQMIDEVLEIDPAGGPWKRGYLRASRAVDPTDWYFAAHFHNDPCMPGFLAIEGAVQGVALFMAAMGFTIERDGFRFDADTGRACPFRWRGQVTPKSQRLEIEVFVESVEAGAEPSVVADVVMSVDGRRSFHVRRLRIKLAQAFPLDGWREGGPVAHQRTGSRVPVAALGGLSEHRETRPCARLGDLELGYDAVLAHAWGRATKAFGPAYERVDRLPRRPRLPAPPFLFISRIADVRTTERRGLVDSEIEVEYDVPAEAWYFEQHAASVMPFAVLLEMLLQPAGWLGSFAIVAPDGDFDWNRSYRNLDGTLTWYAEIPPGAGTLRTRVRLLSSFVIASMMLSKFAIETWAQGRLIAEARSDFGYFPPEALARQAGLPTSEEDRKQREAPSDFSVDLTTRPARYCEGAVRLPGPMLLMLQRVTGYWPAAGKAGLGRLRAEKTLDPGEWFLKAHFYQDPVQPGSLGLEGLCQLLQFFMIENGLGAEVPDGASCR